MAEYTPGPWEIDYCFETGIAIRNVIDGHMDKIICEVWPQRDSIPPGMDMTTDEVAVANATLLVTAPEMRAGIQDAIELIDRPDFDRLNPYWSKVLYDHIQSLRHLVAEESPA